MQKALHIKTTVQPGGKIEIVDQGLPVGESVDVVVSQSPASERRSAVDVLAEAPGGLAFKTAADVAAARSRRRRNHGPVDTAHWRFGLRRRESGHLQCRTH